MTVLNNYSPLPSVRVSVFSESGSDLGLHAVTDTEGKVTFRLPEGNYTFRAEYQSQYFRATAAVTAHQNNLITLDTGGNSLTMTIFKEEFIILSGVKTYLFSESGTDTGLFATTPRNHILL